MSKTYSTQLAAVALNLQGSDVPSWIQLTPAGPDIVGRDGRRWTLPNPEAVVAAFRNNGADLPVDIEHSTEHKAPKGEPAPAVGWIKGMEVRANALWAKVEWTGGGQSLIASGGYRYISPVFTYDRNTTEMRKMLSAGLTNQPNFEMAALNAEGASEENKMDKAILEALGLAANATAVDAVVAINKMKEAETTALNAAQTPDPDKFVPKADHDLALNRIGEFEEADKGRESEAINAAVDAAVEAGKIAPSSKDYHIASCCAEGGLERFSKMVGAAPVIAGDSKLDGKDAAATNTTKLSDEELAVCQALGLTEKEFAAAKLEE